jgi:diketogulonate reductase-like aldo/keto reductase
MERFIFTSKILPSNAFKYDTFMAYEYSLKRLNTERLDLYLIHWPSNNHSIWETSYEHGDIGNGKVW